MFRSCFIELIMYLLSFQPFPINVLKLKTQTIRHFVKPAQFLNQSPDSQQLLSNLRCIRILKQTFCSKMDTQMVVEDFATKTGDAITPAESAKPLLDEIMPEDENLLAEIVKPVALEVESVEQEYPVRTVQTQHGDYRTVDEENIVLLHITRSPVPEEQEEFIWFRSKPFEDDSNDADDEVS